MATLPDIFIRFASFFGRPAAACKLIRRSAGTLARAQLASKSGRHLGRLKPIFLQLMPKASVILREFGQKFTKAYFRRAGFSA
jgi:hypothetical protein